MRRKTKKPENLPEKAMILCAGLGTRMGDLTKRKPKALIKVGGKPLLSRTLKKLRKAGIKKVVINIHAHGDKMLAFVDKYDNSTPAISISDERDELLDTGGGVVKALPALGSQPFFVVNCDVLWRNGTENALHLMARRWDADEMDALLLMIPTASATGYHGQGDFIMDPQGRLIRRDERAVAPWVFGGIQMFSPDFFEDAPKGPFSLNQLYDRAIENDRLFGVRHEGQWFHVGTQDSLTETEQVIKQSNGN